MFANIILMLTLTLKVTLKYPQLRPPKDSRGARRPIGAHQRRDRNFHFPRRTLWRGKTRKICVWTPIKVQTSDCSCRARSTVCTG